MKLGALPPNKPTSANSGQNTAISKAVVSTVSISYNFRDMSYFFEIDCVVFIKNFIKNYEKFVIFSFLYQFCKLSRQPKSPNLVEINTHAYSSQACWHIRFHRCSSNSVASHLGSKNHLKSCSILPDAEVKRHRCNRLFEKALRIHEYELISRSLDF